MSDLQPKVGVAAIITNPNGLVLVGKRKGSHGAGTWQFPGGHLEFKEDIMQCTERETEEETGLKVKAVSLLTATNDIFEAEGKHYITLFVRCHMTDPNDKPQLLEPNKCEGWHWKSWEDIKAIGEDRDSGDSLFLPIVNLLKETPDLAKLKV